MSHPAVQECLRDAKYTSFLHAKATLDKDFQLRARICTDKGTARIAFKDSALTQYGMILSRNAPDPMLSIVETAAHASSSIDTGNPPPLVHDEYAKGKRPLEGGGRGQVLKAAKVETSADRSKGKGNHHPPHSFRDSGNTTIPSSSLVKLTTYTSFTITNVFRKRMPNLPTKSWKPFWGQHLQRKTPCALLKYWKPYATLISTHNRTYMRCIKRSAEMALTKTTTLITMVSK
jgi:hypothetical protein